MMNIFVVVIEVPSSGIEPFLQAQRHPGSPVYTSMTLNMLRFIYSELTPQRIADLKAACRREVCMDGKKGMCHLY